MKHKRFYVCITSLIMAAMVLVACGPTPTEAPVEPTTEPVAAYAADVVTGDCANGQILKEVAAVDELTVKISLCVPDPAFPQKAAFSAFSIQPKEHIESTMVDRSILENPVGTGPYMLDSWKRGESVTLKRYEDYWGDQAKTATLVFRWSTEAAARLLELQSGTVDGIDNPAPDDFDKIKADSTLQFKDRVANNVFYIGFNNKTAPFDNLLVRQAIAIGIDRERIMNNFFPAGTSIADFFTPCTIPNGCVGTPWYTYDPVKAKDLLTQAGYPNGFETTITLRDVARAYLPEPTVVATEVQSQLKKNLNIDTEIVVMESGAFLDEAAAGTVEGIHLLGWNGDYPHITNWLDFHFAASQKQFGNPFPEIYEPLQKGAQIADPKEAEAYYVDANNAVRELVPMIPVVHSGSGVAYRADVQNAHASPLGNEYFAPMVPGSRDTFVWMQNAEPISLYCSDESDGESLRACEQVLESLLAFTIGGQDVVPGLATSCDPNAELTEWTCHLRAGVKFHDGSMLDANDVVKSWVVAWDYTNPLHIGNTGAFEYITTLWGNVLHAPSE